MDDRLKPSVFLHIQKTAGTSVREMASGVYGSENVIGHGDYESRGIESCRAVPFVSGHFGFAFAEALMPGRFGFTFLRNPFDRVISLYLFSRSRPPDESVLCYIAQTVDFHEFLEPKHGDHHWSAVWNNQTTQLHQGWGAGLVGADTDWPWNFDEQTLVEAAVRHLGRFDHIGFRETFASDIRHIFQAIGAPDVQERRSNVGGENNEAVSLKLFRRLLHAIGARDARKRRRKAEDCQIKFEDLPRRTKRRLHEVTKLDWKVYRAPRIFIDSACCGRARGLKCA